ncbi:MAG: phage tail protein, partial [Oscillospiraceae bacterium]|nr:phage tail protein [Oscillospiraceae bacterium]
MSDFGLRIGIEGERDFKAALREINQSFKVLGSEMQLVTSQFDKNDKSVQSLTSRNAVLRKEIDTQKDKIDTLKSALDNASTSFGENDSRTKNWQIQLNKAQAELNGMERELKDNEKALDNVGGEMADTGKET